MKEKFKKILKFLMSKKVIKSIIIILISIILFYTSLFLYSYFFESEKLEIDNYNFNQLEQVKKKFSDLKIESFVSSEKSSWWSMWYYTTWWYNQFNFYNIWDFNRQYNLNIKPIKNCYYFEISNAIYSKNWKYPYIFWFQLESTFYKILNFWKYYSYPWYDLNSNREPPSWAITFPINSWNHKEYVDTNICRWDKKTQEISEKYEKMTRDEKFIYKISNPCTCLDFYDRDK